MNSIPSKPSRAADLLARRSLASLISGPRFFAFVFLIFALRLVAQSNAVTDAATNGVADLAAINLEMTNAYQRVSLIVNQPVKAYVRTAEVSASVYQGGWFHPGANKPDFNTVDVRQTQDLSYAKNKFVTSDLTPTLVFLGADIEFNAMTKWFYTNRALPKHKLTEAQMLEVNRLYRIIGRCEHQIAQARTLPPDEATPDNVMAATTNETETVIPGQSFEGIRKIPIQTRKLYGGIAIAVLILLVVVMRLLKKKSG